MSLLIVLPGLSQAAGCWFSAGLRSGSADAGGTHTTRGSSGPTPLRVHHLFGLRRESSTLAWVFASTRVRSSRSVLPPCCQPVVWCMWHHAAGADDPGAELIPSSPNNARYWSIDPRRLDLPK